MKYELKILANDGEEIFLTTSQNNAGLGTDANAITSVSYKVDTVNENPNDRADNVLVKLEISGDLTDTISSECEKMLKWSMLTASQTVYRKVILTIKVSDTKLLRKYIIPDMFVEDYFEDYRATEDGGASSNSGKYTLKLVQRHGRLSTIDTASTPVGEE